MELKATIEINNTPTSQVSIKKEKKIYPVRTVSYEQIFFDKTGKNFNEFYDKYYEKLVWSIEKMNLNHIDAEDIANQGFMRALDKIEQYNPEYNFSTWLFDITKKIAFQYMKDSKKMIAVDINGTEDSDNEDYSALNGYIVHKLADDYYHNFENEIQLSKKYTETLREISKLDPKYRTIIELSDIQGKSYNEICEHLGNELGSTYEQRLQTVKNRLHHGRKKLEKTLSDKFKHIQKNY